MIDKLRSLRLNVSLGAVLMLLMGLLFLFRPAEVVAASAQFVGIILILVGITQFFGKLLSDMNRASGMLMGALIFVVGFWIFMHPLSAASIIPMMIGVILIVHGVQNIGLAFTARGYNMPGWGFMLAGGVLNLMCGVACVVMAFAAVAFVVQLSGLMMIYDGVTSMVTVQSLNRYESKYVDVEFREL